MLPLRLALQRLPLSRAPLLKSCSPCAGHCGSRRFQARASSADSEELLAALDDKELLKTSVGFIDGDFVSAGDEGTFDVSRPPARSARRPMRCPSSGCQQRRTTLISSRARSWVCACMQVVNPATGEVIAKAPLMKGAETRAAIAAAETAFPTWSRQVAKERCKVMRRRAASTLP